MITFDTVAQPPKLNSGLSQRRSKRGAPSGTNRHATNASGIVPAIRDRIAAGINSRRSGPNANAPSNGTTRNAAIPTNDHVLNAKNSSRPATAPPITDDMTATKTEPANQGRAAVTSGSNSGGIFACGKKTLPAAN